MTASTLIADLEARGVTVEPVVGDHIRVCPASALSAHELAALRRLKPEILALLARRAEGSPATARPCVVRHLDAVTVRDVLGPRPDPNTLDSVAREVSEVVERLRLASV